MSEKRSYRSYSQLSNYERCPYSYKLARIDKVPERPAAWLPMGIGVHEAAETYEKSGRDMTTDEVVQSYKDSYIKHTNRLLKEQPDPSQWFSSGPYQGEADIERRFTVGQQHTRNYVDYYETHPEDVIWVTPEGKPAIELRFDIELEGVPVVGYIDQVIDSGDGKLKARDIKSGATPGTSQQLALYSLALEDITKGGKSAAHADFLMTKTGKPTKPYAMDDPTKDHLVADFVALDKAVLAGEFPATPSPKLCSRCPVAAACEFRQA